MKRKLLRQIGNEWQTNVWLSIELLIVSVVMWYITDFIYTKISISSEPRGFNTEHCYLINYSELNEQSPEYIPDRTKQERNDDLHTMLDRLEKRPEVECVAMGQNSYLYNGSNSGMYLECDTFNTAKGWALLRRVSPDFPRVFRIYGADGETPEQLAELLKDRNGILISDNLFQRQYGIESMKDFIGKEFSTGNNGDTLVMRGSYQPVRYDDFRSAAWSLSVMLPVPEDSYTFFNEMVVRVHENMDKDFIENLMKDADRHFRIGNYYIASVQSFDDIRQIHQRDNISELRTYFTGAAFLALNIFLGLLGTFWFRTSQRIPEIAIRKANGATRSDIFRRVIGEGELLLLLVTPLAAVFDYLIAHFELNAIYPWDYFEPTRFFSCIAISWGFMALMIFLGILIPANRAMNIAPARALMGE